MLRFVARCGIIGVKTTRVVAWFPSPQNRILLAAAKEGKFYILSGSLVWRKSTHRRYNLSDVPIVLLQSIDKIWVKELGIIIARSECLFANFSRWQSMLSCRFWQFPVCSNVFVMNAPPSWSSEHCHCFEVALEWCHD